MKSTTMNKPVEDTSYTQMLAKADSELARLSAQEQQIRLQMQADQAALLALKAQAQAHATEKQIAQETINARRSALREAEARAELAEGTLLSKPGDVKALEKLLRQAQQDHMVILDRIGKAEQAEERRHLALTEAIDGHHKTLAHLAERKEAMEVTKQRIRTEQGEALLQAHLEQLHKLQDTLREQEQVIELVRQDIEGFVSEATDSLADWPAFQSQFSTTLLYEDSLTRILTQEIRLIEQVLNEGRGTQIDIVVARAVHQPYVGLTELLSIDQHYIRPSLSLQGSTELLEERKAHIEAVLVAHRALKQGRMER